jgi:hypothetical protein
MQSYPLLMTTTTSFEDQAIPHEAGHILVGWILNVPLRGLEVEIAQDASGRENGNFVTLGSEPSQELLARLPPQILTTYKLFVAGGLAGNHLANVSAEETSLQNDRQRLALVGTESLEQLAVSAARIITANQEIFNRLNLLIRERFIQLISSGDLPPARYSLLNKQDLEEIFAKPQG